jgi:hypothetical protein
MEVTLNLVVFVLDATHAENFAVEILQPLVGFSVQREIFL